MTTVELLLERIAEDERLVALVRDLILDEGNQGEYIDPAHVLAEHDAKVRTETVEYVAQIAADTLRACQAGGLGEKNILSPEREAGFQLCIDNIANLAKSMKEKEEA